MNIAIIGSGGIGIRHLQAVAQMTRNVCIYVVDISAKSIETAKQAYESVPHASVEEIHWLDKIAELPEKIDVAVVATSSKPRRKIIEDLLQHTLVTYLILEKFLFTTTADYAEITEFLKGFPCKTWVNCNRRMSEFYGTLRDMLATYSLTSYSASGTGWGLGCNGIHMIDLLAFLLGDSSGFTFEPSGLDQGHIESKRGGYIEFTGELKGFSPKCSKISIVCNKGEITPITIKLAGPDIQCEILESTGTARICRKDNGWQEEIISFLSLYQSQLTGKLAEQLADTGTCTLPTYEESIQLHIPVLSAFLEHLNKYSDEEITVCPIT